MESITQFFANNFASFVWLAAILVAIIPTLEAKIAIPFVMSEQIFGANALSGIWAFALCFVGSMLPAVLVFWLSRKMKQRISLLVVERKSITKKLSLLASKNRGKYLALCGFVALPLPLTGVWTGSLIAGLSDLDPKKSIAAIALGAGISSAIITMLCVLCENSTLNILLASLALVALFALVQVVSIIISRLKAKLK